MGKYFSGESFSNVVSLIHSELELTMVALHLQPNSTTAGGLRRNSRMYDGNIMIERTETEPVLLHPGRAWLIGEVSLFTTLKVYIVLVKSYRATISPKQCSYINFLYVLEHKIIIIFVYIIYVYS